MLPEERYLLRNEYSIPLIIKENTLNEESEEVTLKIEPMFCRIFVANLGSVGLDAPYHQLYDWANSSISVVM